MAIPTLSFGSAATFDRMQDATITGIFFDLAACAINNTMAHLQTGHLSFTQHLRRHEQREQSAAIPFVLQRRRVADTAKVATGSKQFRYTT